jgi:hypothetical protein
MRARVYVAYRNPNDEIYQEFYALALMVIAFNVRVDQPYPFFAHQDLSPEIRGTSDTGNRNDTYHTDSTGFGPTPGWKAFYVAFYPAIYP